MSSVCISSVCSVVKCAHEPLTTEFTEVCTESTEEARIENIENREVKSGVPAWLHHQLFTSSGEDGEDFLSGIPFALE